MIDREKVLAVLHKRFPGASPEQVAAAANAIVGLEEEWVDVTARQPTVDSCLAATRAERCFLADERQRGCDLRILVKPPADQ